MAYRERRDALLPPQLGLPRRGLPPSLPRVHRRAHSRRAVVRWLSLRRRGADERLGCVGRASAPRPSRWKKSPRLPYIAPQTATRSGEPPPKKGAFAFVAGGGGNKVTLASSKGGGTCAAHRCQVAAAHSPTLHRDAGAPSQWKISTMTADGPLPCLERCGHRRGCWWLA